MVTFSYAQHAVELPSRTPVTNSGVEVQARRQLRICISLLYTTILLSIFAIPAGGDKQLPISFLLGLTHFGLLAALTRFAFDPVRLLAVAAAFALTTLESGLFPSSFSPTSLFYMPVIYLPLALTLPLLTASDVRTIWKHVSILGCITAWLGLTQMVVQIVTHGYFLDPFRLLPPSLLLQHYNTTYPITYGATLLKPNGMVLLEPSFFSQMVALGLLSELVFFKRKWRIVLFLSALATSFSGSGMIMLIPAFLFLGSVRTLLSFAVLAAVLIGVLALSGYGSIYLGRATETSESGSSGHARFVEPYKIMWESWEEDATSCFFGKGAGVAGIGVDPTEANFGPISKVGVEYGIVGLAFFTWMWITMFKNLVLPNAIVFALIVFYFAASSSFLQPFTIFTLWAITGGFLHRSPDLKSPTRIFRPGVT